MLILFDVLKQNVSPTTFSLTIDQNTGSNILPLFDDGNSLYIYGMYEHDMVKMKEHIYATNSP